jgi:hypothetical protein
MQNKGEKKEKKIILKILVILLQNNEKMNIKNRTVLV